MTGPTKVKFNAIDETDGSLVTLEFESYVLSMDREPGKIVTRFSNGCVLVQRQAEPVAVNPPATNEVTL